MSLFPIELRKDGDVAVPGKIYYCRNCDSILLHDTYKYCPDCGHELDDIQLAERNGTDRR